MNNRDMLINYIRNYGREAERVRSHRYSWEDWKQHPKAGVDFYPGIRTYFNPDRDYDFRDEKVDYHAIIRVMDILKDMGVSQKNVASYCGIHESNINKWKNMEKRPNKYQWWAVAVEVKLPYDLIPAFLLMIGEVIEPMRIEDQIIYSQMKKDGARCSRFSVSVALKEDPLLSEDLKREKPACNDALKAFGVIYSEKPLDK